MTKQAPVNLLDNEARSIVLLFRKLNKALDRELSPLGLTHGRYIYLFGLYVENGRTQQSLADAAASDKAATTRSLCRLEEDGFIERKPDETDRRLVRVYLTEMGRALRPKLEGALQSAIDEIVEPLGVEQRRVFRQLLSLAISV